MSEHKHFVKGSIRPFIATKHAFSTGRYIATAAERPNVVAYSAADIMASLCAGDMSYKPGHIGFVYGTSADPGIVDPKTQPLDERRQQKWADISVELAALGANMAIAPLSAAPSVMLGDSSSSTKYSANAMPVSSHTGLVFEYAFSGSGFADTIENIEAGEGDVYVYHVFLLNRRVVNGRIIYTPFSRASISDPPFVVKPAAAEQGVFWTIEFE